MASQPKNRIVREAAHLHSRDGLDAVSMRAVAARIGVSATSIYRHFRDKDALIGALVETGFAKLVTYFERQPKSSRLPRSRVVIANFLDFAMEEPRLYELLFLVRRPQLREYPRDFAARKSPAFDVVREAVEYDMAAGVLRKDDSLETALNVWAFAHGLISMFTLGRFGNDVALFRTIYSNAFDRMYAGLAAGKERKR